MEKVVNQDGVEGVEEKFRRVSKMLGDTGYNRTPLAVKNQYSRYLRQFGIDERRKPDPTNLTTSTQKPKRKITDNEDENENENEDSTPPRPHKKARMDSDDDRAEGSTIRTKMAGKEADDEEAGPSSRGTKRRKQTDYYKNDDYEPRPKKRAKGKGKFSFVVEQAEDEDDSGILGNQAGPR